MLLPSLFLLGSSQAVPLIPPKKGQVEAASVLDGDFGLIWVHENGVCAGFYCQCRAPRRGACRQADGGDQGRHNDLACAECALSTCYSCLTNPRREMGQGLCAHAGRIRCAAQPPIRVGPVCQGRALLRRTRRAKWMTSPLQATRSASVSGLGCCRGWRALEQSEMSVFRLFRPLIAHELLAKGSGPETAP